MNNETKARVATVVEGWNAILPELESDPNNWKPYVSNLAIVNEAVVILSEWFNRAKAPTGFAPIFHLAKGLLDTSLSAMEVALKGIEGGEYGQLRVFVASINQCLGITHTLIVFSDKYSSSELTNDLSAELQQALALLGTAQQELKNKTDKLNSAEELLSKITAAVEKLDKTSSKGTEILKSLEDLEVGAESSAENIEEHEKIIKEATDRLSTLEKTNKELADKLRADHETLQKLQQTNEAQAKTIHELLPNAAGTGLAYAFGHRKAQLGGTRNMWMTAFILSLLGLCAISFWIISMTPHATETLWLAYLQRLPLVAPLVWLAWFSAIQYGNVIRVQEDYAFKEATSNAFAGYRSHMEHLAQISDDEGKTALNALAIKTIEILAKEPLRIYQHQDHDASPSSKLMSFFEKGKSAKPE
jgi:hypothetical protein